MNRQRLVSIPDQFLSQCDQWEFVLEVIRHCIDNGNKQASRRTLYGPQNTGIDLASPVRAGTYTYIREGETLVFHSHYATRAAYNEQTISSDDSTRGCIYQRGPESNRRGRAPAATGSESSYSNSKRSCINQVSATAERCFRRLSGVCYCWRLLL